MVASFFRGTLCNFSPYAQVSGSHAAGGGMGAGGGRGGGGGGGGGGYQSGTNYTRADTTANESARPTNFAGRSTNPQTEDGAQSTGRLGAATRSGPQGS